MPSSQSWLSKSLFVISPCKLPLLLSYNFEPEIKDFQNWKFCGRDIKIKSATNPSYPELTHISSHEIFKYFPGWKLNKSVLVHVWPHRQQSFTWANYDRDIWHCTVWMGHSKIVIVPTIPNWPLQDLGAHETWNDTKSKVHMTDSSVDKIAIL